MTYRISSNSGSVLWSRKPSPRVRNSGFTESIPYLKDEGAHSGQSTGMVIRKSVSIMPLAL